MGADLLVRALTGAWNACPVGTNTTDWIGAISTATLGLFGAIFTVWQFWAQGFRPRCTAKIDLKRQAILLLIRNHGRADGVVARIVLVDADGLAMDPPAPIDGYPSGFATTTLPSRAAMRLVIVHPPDLETIPDGTRIKIDWGTGNALKVPQPVDVGYLGLSSVLPPGYGVAAQRTPGTPTVPTASQAPDHE